MTKSSLARNTGASTIVYVLGSIAGLVLVPILLRALGPTQFGLYVLAQTLLSYSSLLGGGMNRGFVRLIVAREVDSGREAVRAVIGTGLVTMTLFGILVVGVVATAYPLLLELFRVPASYGAAFGAILVGATAAYVLNAVATPYQGLLVARQRLDLAKTVEALAIVTGSACSAVAALMGLGLPGVAVAMASVAALSTGLMIASAFRVDRDAASASPRLDRTVIAELWAFGSRAQLVSLAGMINRSIDRISIGMFLPAASIAVYDVGDRAAFSIVYTANTMAEAIGPQMAAHIARDDIDSARKMYMRSAGIFSVSATLFASFAAFQGQLVLRTWLGEMFDVRAAWVMAILAAGYGIGVSFSATHLVAMSQARPTLAMRFSIVQAALNVVLSFAGAAYAGIIGAAIGSAISGGIGAILYSVLVERQILMSKRVLGLRRLGLAVLIAVPTGVLIAAVTRWVASATGSGRIALFALLVCALCLQVAITVALGSHFGLLPRNELQLLARRAGARLTGRNQQG